MKLQIKTWKILEVPEAVRKQWRVYGENDFGKDSFKAGSERERKLKTAQQPLYSLENQRIKADSEPTF